MIRVTDIINAKLRSRRGGQLRGTSTHNVRVVLTGRDTLDGLARRVEAHGNVELATNLRRAKSFTMTMPAAKWAMLNGSDESAQSAQSAVKPA